MAFPGQRVKQKKILVKADALSGTPDYDQLLFFSEIHFGDADKTLGGSGAIRQGGGDLAISTDEDGLYRLPLHVVRCVLNADPSLSKIDLVSRRPALDTLIDREIWIWFNSPDDVNDVLPADDADYGRNDVYQGLTDSDGTSVPFSTWGVYHFSNDPQSAAPNVLDDSGNNRTGYQDGGVYPSSIEMSPGKGWWANNKQFAAFCNTPWNPRTYNFATYYYVPAAYASQNSSAPYRTGGMVDFQNANRATQAYWKYPTNNSGGSNETYITPSNSDRLISFTRSSDTAIRLQVNAAYTSNSLAAGTDYYWTGITLVHGGGTTTTACTFSLILANGCAPNRHWALALYNSIANTNGFYDYSFSSNTVGVFGEWVDVVFDNPRDGTKISIYETPHNAIWTLDFTGMSYAALVGEYVEFQVVNESSTSDHYLYVGTDPALSGKTGHAVSLTGSETDAQVAAAFEAVFEAITDITSSVTGAVVTITNERNGQIDRPLWRGTEAEVLVEQIGSTSVDLIDSIASTSGDWTSTFLVDQPRLVWIAFGSVDTKIVQFKQRVDQNNASIPVGLLQSEDTAI